jgi:hypothetical protein
MHFIYLPQERDQWRLVLNTLKKLSDSQMSTTFFFTALPTAALSNSIVPHQGSFGCLLMQTCICLHSDAPSVAKQQPTVLFHHLMMMACSPWHRTAW